MRDARQRKLDARVLALQDAHAVANGIERASLGLARELQAETRAALEHVNTTAGAASSTTRAELTKALDVIANAQRLLAACAAAIRRAASAETQSIQQGGEQ